MDRSKLLNNLDAAWNELLTSCANLSDTEMMCPGAIGEWSVKDIIAHVTAWEQEALTHLPTILEGRRPPRYSVKYGGIDAFNAQVIAQKRALPLAEVIRQRDETHQRLIDFIRRVPEEQLIRETRFRHRLRLDTYSHYPIHTKAILQWRENKE